jgi:DNA repair protein RadC
VNACLISPADVYRRVLAHADAAACIVGHNHPSGDVSPSAEEHALTKRLKSAGRVLGITLMDHVVVSAVSRAGAHWWSFQDHGEL